MHAGGLSTGARAQSGCAARPAPASQPAELIARNWATLATKSGEVIVDLDALVTAREAQDYPPLRKAGVCRHTIAMWRAKDRLRPVDKVGRSPRYRWGDLLRVERDTRLSPRGAPRSSRCRSCERAAEREREEVMAA